MINIKNDIHIDISLLNTHIILYYLSVERLNINPWCLLPLKLKLSRYNLINKVVQIIYSEKTPCN